MDSNRYSNRYRNIYSNRYRYRMRTVIWMVMIAVLCLGGRTVFAGSKAAVTPKAVTVKTISGYESQRVKITWTASSDHTDYYVFYRKAGGKWIPFPKVDPTKTTFTHVASREFPLIPGTTYYYTVAAYNRNYKTWGEHETPGKSYKAVIHPPKVTLVSAAIAGENKVKVTWKKVSGATHYVIYYREYGQEAYKKIRVVSASASSYVHTASAAFPLKPNTKYTYTVKAYNKNYDVGGAVDRTGVTVTTTRKYTVPAGVTETLRFGGSLGAGVSWNKMYGSKTYLSMLGINPSKYAQWLTKHSGDKYYLGTPYPSIGTANPSRATPLGDRAGYAANMNCTAFVWHVLWKSMQLSGKKTTPASIGLGTGRLLTYAGWSIVPVNRGVQRGYFRTKADLMNIGKPKKGDIIWFMARSKTGNLSIGTSAYDNHIMIYMGDGKSDLAWHSAGAKIWCDGTYDGVNTHSRGGHYITVGNQNVLSEIGGPQDTQFGYILFRTGAVF